MIFTDGTTVSDALASRQVKRLLPNLLDSATIKEILDSLPEDVRQSVLASAGVYDARILDQLNGLVSDMAAGEETLASARLQLGAMMKDLGMPAGLMAEARLNLMIDTQLSLARGLGGFIQANDPTVIDLWPAMELFRLGSRKEPRDWPTRWEAAGGELYGGRMIARKDSGVWQSLGNGEGGFTDTLGNPFPPFAFNSGMWWESVSRKEAVALEVIGQDDTVTPQPTPDFSRLMQVPMDINDAALRSAILERFPDLQFANGVLTAR